MLDFPQSPKAGDVFIAFGFGALLFTFDGQRWVADAADVLNAMERMAQDRERLARERVMRVFERVYGRPFPEEEIGC